MRSPANKFTGPDTGDYAIVMLSRRVLKMTVVVIMMVMTMMVVIVSVCICQYY